MSHPENPPENAEAPANTAPSEIDQLKAQLEEEKKKFLYLYAEFETYKRRTSKERSEILKFGWEGVALELLQILDNFERAMAHAGDPKQAGNVVQGIRFILDQFKSVLEKNGVERFKTQGQIFSPEWHEAVDSKPSPEPEGTILAEQLGGYKFHGRLLRPAQVVVSKGA